MDRFRLLLYRYRIPGEVVELGGCLCLGQCQSAVSVSFNGDVKTGVTPEVAEPLLLEYLRDNQMLESSSLDTATGMVAPGAARAWQRPKVAAGASKMKSLYELLD